MEQKQEVGGSSAEARRWRAYKWFAIGFAGLLVVGALLPAPEGAKVGPSTPAPARDIPLRLTPLGRARVMLQQIDKGQQPEEPNAPLSLDMLRNKYGSEEVARAEFVEFWTREFEIQERNSRGR